MIILLLDSIKKATLLVLYVWARSVVKTVSGSASYCSSSKSSSLNLLEQLLQIPDYRHIRGRRPELWLVLLLIWLGAMVGYYGYRPWEDFTKVNRQNLIDLLHLPDTVKFPSYSTFRRVLKTIDFRPFTDLFNTLPAKKRHPTPSPEARRGLMLINVVLIGVCVPLNPPLTWAKILWVKVRAASSINRDDVPRLWVRSG